MYGGVSIKKLSKGQIFAVLTYTYKLWYNCVEAVINRLDS